MNASIYRTIQTLSGVFLFLLCIFILYNTHIIYSLLPKIDELQALILAHKPHLICIVETYGFTATSLIVKFLLKIIMILAIRRDGNRQGGGVMFFVIKSLSYNVLFSGPPALEFTVLNFKSSISSVTVHRAFLSFPQCTCFYIFDT